jgi:hypothetical protein
MAKGVREFGVDTSGEQGGEESGDDEYSASSS